MVTYRVFAVCASLVACLISAVGCNRSDSIEILATTDFSRPTPPKSAAGLTGDNVRVEPGMFVFNSDEWGVSEHGVLMSLSPQMTSVVMPIDARSGGLLTDVAVTFLAAGGHGTLPEMPVVSVRRFDPLTNEVEVLGEIEDPSADVSSYQNLHFIQVSNLNLPLEAGKYRYQVTLQSEYGPNAIAGAYVSALAVRVLPQ